MTALPSLALIGPGAIGATVAAWLSRSGAVGPVSVCARTPIQCLRVETPEGLIEARPRVLTHPSQAEAVDWVLIATKTYDAEPTGRWLAPLVGPETRVAVLQNGVEHVARFRPWVPVERIVPVVVEIPAERSAPGIVVQRKNGWLKAPAGANGAAFCALFEGPGIVASVEDDWTSLAWTKLALNCAGAVSALTGLPGGVVRAEGMAGLMRGMAGECLAVGRAEGAALGDHLPDWVVERAMTSPPDSVNSMLADRLAGRPMEWDARNGVIARRGAANGIPTPLNAMAATLLSAMD